MLAHGSPRLTFYDEKGRDREVLHVGANGEPGYALAGNGDQGGV